MKSRTKDKIRNNAVLVLLAMIELTLIAILVM